MKIAIFGATGTSGTAVLGQALDAGHTVRVLARTPAKISRTDPALTVIAGDAKNPAAVAETLTGCSVVISTLGGFADTDSIRLGTAVIIGEMRDAGIRRIIVVQGFHLDFPGDPHNLGRKTILPLLWLGSRSLIPDSRAMAAGLQASNLDWTLVRVPRITRGPATGRARIGRLSLGPFSSVSNGDIAAFVLASLGNPSWFAQAPMIAHHGCHARGAAGYSFLGRRPVLDSSPVPAPRHGD